MSNAGDKVFTVQRCQPRVFVWEVWCLGIKKQEHHFEKVYLERSVFANGAMCLVEDGL